MHQRRFEGRNVSTIRPDIDFRRSARPEVETALRGSVPQRLLRDRQTLIHWFQWGTSVAWVVALLYAVTVQYTGAFAVEYRFLAVTTPMLMLVVYRSLGVFRCFGSLASTVMRLTRGWLLVLAALLAVAFVTQTSAEYSRYVVGVWAVAALAGQLVLFLGTQWLSHLWQRRLQVNLRALVVGSGYLARHLATSINRNPFLPDHVAGIVDDRNHSMNWDVDDIPVLGSIESLPRLLSQLDVDRIYVALPVERSEEMGKIQRDLLEYNVDVIWAPDIFSFNLLNHCVHEIAGVPLISLSESPLTSGGRAFLKSFADIVLALGILIVMAPVMLALAAAVKLTSSGPVFFKQRRHGWDGEVFMVRKFRTMYLHDEQGEVTQARRDDPRTTPLGRFMRRTSLDELPQLFNVLDGTMSLVGPRPHAVVHNRQYSQQIAAYMARHRVKPGITGWAQIHGYRGETRTIEKMVERVRLDLEYINNWSLGLDLRILLQTPFALFSRNAY